MAVRRTCPLFSCCCRFLPATKGCVDVDVHNPRQARQVVRFELYCLVSLRVWPRPLVARKLDLPEGSHQDGRIQQAGCLACAGGAGPGAVAGRRAGARSPRQHAHRRSPPSRMQAHRRLWVLRLQLHPHPPEAHPGPHASADSEAGVSGGQPQARWLGRLPQHLPSPPQAHTHAEAVQRSRVSQRHS